MSLYRTWRPKSFLDLVGQDAVVRTLSTALTSGKLAHAYLFSGPRGSGKTSAAKILARCIDCVRGPTPEPDNTCDNCRAMLAGTALDVVEIDAASNRGIDEIRALRDAAKFAPSSMRMKVFIIDEAHMLTREGANAFLKTLEEPPPHVVFVLATTAPESLPPTILSRCQRYAFRRIPVSVMVERMRVIASAEGIAASEDALAAIAYRADGGLRDALTMLEQVAAYAGPLGSPVVAATVDAAFGITGRHFARQLVDAILGVRAAEGLRVVDEASDAGADMLGLIRGAIGEYRNLMVARVDASLLSRDLAETDAAAAIALAAATPQPKIVRGLRLLADALAAGRLSGNPRLELETAVLRLIVQTEDPSLEALSTRVALLESVAGSLPVDTPTRPEPAPKPAKRESAKRSLDVAPPAHVPPAVAVVPEAVLAPVIETPRASAEPHRADRESQPPRDPVTPPVASELTPPVASEQMPPVASELTPPVASESMPAVAEPMPVVAAESIPAESEFPDAAAVAVSKSNVLPSASVAPTLQQVRSLWDQIRLRAEESHKPLRSLLARATVDGTDDGTLTIGVPDSIQESLIRGKLDVIENAVEAVLRTRLRVILRARLTAGAPRAPATSAHGASKTEPLAAPGGGSEIASANASSRESATTTHGEFDLLAYARKKLGGTE